MFIQLVLSTEITSFTNLEMYIFRYKIPNSVPISSKEWLNIDELIDVMWKALDLVRVYTKPRGQSPDYSAPVVLKRGKSSIEDFCNAIHKEIAKQLK